MNLYPLMLTLDSELSAASQTKSYLTENFDLHSVYFVAMNYITFRFLFISIEFFTIRISVRLSNISEVTQHKINFVKNCPQ